ncbi:FmdB family zinc ribbon protein [Pelovirga terrestris]|uniref:Zinc ribbon domain-containing protein n=1 Tax=Pelovirga terrestris TaxID=2771352 RepID=A0A8J6UIN8_9BACT|nr:zinc ribbon domain-containing protein [Pelovirga terrestris]
MPIFEYQCPQCGKITEKIQTRSQTDIPCPVCFKPAVRRVSRSAISTSGSSCGSSSGAGFT